MGRKIRIKILRLIGGVIVVGGIILFSSRLFNPPCNRCERPVNVPAQAIWKGGHDGGHWIELVNMKNDTIRFRIYRDFDGALILDADFIPKTGNDLHLTRANWDSLIDYFDGEKIGGKIKPENEYLQWALVSPAYYEEKK